MNAIREQPDILWIVTTQWRAQATGYAGDPNARTPNLDALAARSVNFTQAVTPHPFGPFARATLLTGVLSPENGVRDYFDPLPTDARTIAHELGDLGYTTAYFGKWHLGKRDPAAALVGETHAKTIVPPDARGGFDFWEGFEGGFLLNDPWLHGTRLAEPTRFVGYQAEVLAERTGSWIAEQLKSVQPRKPLFCVMSLESPHPPYDTPALGVKPRDPQSLVLPANVPKGSDAEQKARRELAGYYAHIEATDRTIGKLLRSVGDGVMVVFTSVHGDMHGAHGLFRKGWPHEESVRVPLLVQLPAGRGEVREDPVSLVDLRRLTQIFAKTGQLERIQETSTKISMPSVVRLPHQCDRIWTGQRSKNTKEIFNADGSTWMRFDLTKDPGEMHNLADAG
ncbi:MAG: sulfatase-like hydrolase/transferase [Nibricoccus sp.]